MQEATPLFYPQGCTIPAAEIVQLQNTMFNCLLVIAAAVYTCCLWHFLYILTCSVIDATMLYRLFGYWFVTDCYWSNMYSILLFIQYVIDVHYLMPHTKEVVKLWLHRFSELYGRFDTVWWLVDVDQDVARMQACTENSGCRCLDAHCLSLVCVGCVLFHLYVCEKGNTQPTCKKNPKPAKIIFSLFHIKL